MHEKVLGKILAEQNNKIKISEYSKNKRAHPVVPF